MTQGKEKDKSQPSSPKEPGSPKPPSNPGSPKDKKCCCEEFPVSDIALVIERISRVVPTNTNNRRVVSSNISPENNVIISGDVIDLSLQNVFIFDTAGKEITLVGFANIVPGKRFTFANRSNGQVYVKAEDAYPFFSPSGYSFVPSTEFGGRLVMTSRTCVEFLFVGDGFQYLNGNYALLS